jgi:hypothetical protein
MCAHPFALSSSHVPKKQNIEFELPDRDTSGVEYVQSMSFSEEKTNARRVVLAPSCCRNILLEKFAEDIKKEEKGFSTRYVAKGNSQSLQRSRLVLVPQQS